MADPPREVSAITISMEHGARLSDRFEPGRDYGFSGTGHEPGMTEQQRMCVTDFLNDNLPCALHLGDCIWADQQAYQIALDLGVYTVGHPPASESKRAFCEYDESRQPLPYLERNHFIVLEGVDGLIATPRTYDMPKSLRGQGTWWTIREAMRLARPLNVFLPDGTRWTP